MNEEVNVVEDLVKRRIQKRIQSIHWDKLDIDHCYIGGNSCNRMKPNDYDLFPIGTNSFENKDADVLMKTKNAITLNDGDNIVQLCNFKHESLEKLVSSFDFAHIQVGAELERVSTYGDNTTMCVVDVFCTDAWEKSHIMETTWYTGSQYPMSSLIRLLKYYKRGQFSGNSHIFEIIKILDDFVGRGFDDYADFKDQLDAVDLAMVGEGEDLTYPFLTLFDKMRKDK